MLPDRVRKFTIANNITFRVKIEVNTNNGGNEIDKWRGNHIVPDIINIIICILSRQPVFPIISFPGYWFFNEQYCTTIHLLFHLLR